MLKLGDIETTAPETARTETTKEAVSAAITRMTAAGYRQNGSEATYRLLASYYARFLAGKPMKGLFLYGFTGRGKSLFMERLIKPHISTDNFLSAPDLQQHYASHGARGMDSLLDLCRQPRPDRDWPRSSDLVIDDLLSEKVGKHYGVSADVIPEMIAEIYPYAKRNGFCLHLTANQHVDSQGARIPIDLALEDRYGARTVSRIMELCEPIELNGRDMRL